MMTFLVQALLQPNYSYYRINKEKDTDIKKQNATRDQDTNSTNCKITHNASDLSKHSEHFLVKFVGKESNDRTSIKRHAKNHKIHISKYRNNGNVKESKELHHKAPLITKRTKLYASNRHNYLHKYKFIGLLLFLVHTIIKPVRSNLLVLVNKDKYLYIKSQLTKYNYTMESNDIDVKVNGKLNGDIFITMKEYSKSINKNRIFYITCKLLASIRDDIPTFREIIWHLITDNGKENDNICIKMNQKGIKIEIYIMNTDLNHDMNGTIGTKVELDTDQLINYIEITDLLISYNGNRSILKEDNKFSNIILNTDKDKDIWIKSGEIIDNFNKELWHLTEDDTNIKEQLCYNVKI